MHSDKDCDLWIRSHGNLTEQDQQFGSWLRAPITLPKKCSLVKVKGLDREVVRDAPRPVVVPDNYERDGNLIINQGVTRSDEVSPSSDKCSGEIKDGMDTSEHLSAKGGRTSEDF